MCNKKKIRKEWILSHCIVYKDWQAISPDWNFWDLIMHPVNVLLSSAFLIRTCIWLLMVGGRVVFSVNSWSGVQGIKLIYDASCWSQLALLLNQSPCTGQSVCSGCFLLITELRISVPWMSSAARPVQGVAAFFHLSAECPMSYCCVCLAMTCTPSPQTTLSFLLFFFFLFSVPF